MMPFSIVVASLLFIATAMRMPTVVPTAQPEHAIGNAPVNFEKTIGEAESFIDKAQQPVVADNPPRDPRVGKNIKHFRQGPFNEGDRTIDIYCILIQHALEDSLEDHIAEKNLMTNINIASFLTIGQVKLASTGNVSCKAVYKVPQPGDPEQDPYVEVDFATKGLNISSSAVTTHVASARSWFGWQQPALDATVDMGFTMDIDFGLKINTVHYNMEITKSKVMNLEPRSSSEESTLSSIAALAVKMGIELKRVGGVLVPDSVTAYINQVLARMGGYLGTRLIDPETSCKVMKYAILPLAITDLDFSSIEPISILGKMLKFRAEHVRIPPSFLCRNFSFNGRRLIVDLRDVEVNAQMSLESIVSAEDGEGNVEHAVDLNSSINTIATLHLVQSINLDLDILEPHNTIIMPSNVTVDVQVQAGYYQQMFANFAASVSQFSMNQFGWVASSLAAWILEKELRKDMPLLEQKGGAAPAFEELTSIGFVAGLHDVWNSVWDWALAAPRIVCDKVGGCMSQVQQWSAYRPSLL